MTIFVTPHASPDGYVLSNAVIFACENTAEAERLLAAEAEKNGQKFVQLIEAEVSRANNLELPEGVDSVHYITVYCAMLDSKKTFATLDTDAEGFINKNATFYGFDSEEEAKKFIEEKIEKMNEGADKEDKVKLAGVQSGYYQYPDCIVRFGEMPSWIDLDRIAKAAGLETYMNLCVCYTASCRSCYIKPAPRVIVPEYA